MSEAVVDHAKRLLDTYHERLMAERARAEAAEARADELARAVLPQHEVVEWARRNFPGTTPEVAVLGLAEEAGEVCRAALKSAQGIRGTPDYWRAEIAKELGDVVIKAMDVAAFYDLDLARCIAERWAAVRQRDWVADRLTGRVACGEGSGS